MKNKNKKRIHWDNTTNTDTHCLFGTNLEQKRLGKDGDVRLVKASFIV